MMATKTTYICDRCGINYGDKYHHSPGDYVVSVKPMPPDNVWDYAYAVNIDQRVDLCPLCTTALRRWFKKEKAIA